MAIEAHGQVADEDLAEADGAHAVAVDLTHTVGHEGRQLGERIAQVFSKHDAMGGFDGFAVHDEVAHQGVDHVAADLVVGRALVTARDRQLSRVEHAVVVHEFLFVLHQRAAHVADGRDAEAEHIGASHHGVAHEIALQTALALGDCQFVGGQGEVVHADGLVAGIHETLARDGEQRELFVAGGQRRSRDVALVAALVGQVGERIDRHAIRPQGNGLRDGAREGFRRLAGQPVD